MQRYRVQRAVAPTEPVAPAVVPAVVPAAAATTADAAAFSAAEDAIVATTTKFVPADDTRFWRDVAHNLAGGHHASELEGGRAKLTRNYRIVSEIEYPEFTFPMPRFDEDKDREILLRSAKNRDQARRDSAEDFSRLNALLFTAVAWIFIPA